MLCCNPPIDQKLVFFCFLLPFLERNIDVEQKTRLKLRKNAKIRKRASNEIKKTANQKTERIGEKQTFKLNILMLFLA